MKTYNKQIIAFVSMAMLLVYISYVNEATGILAQLLGLGRVSAGILATIPMVVFVCVIEYYTAPTTILRNKKVLAVFDGAWLVVAAVGIVITVAKSEGDYEYKFAVRQTLQNSQLAMLSSIHADRHYSDVYEAHCVQNGSPHQLMGFCSALIKLKDKISNLRPLSSEELKEIGINVPSRADERITIFYNSLRLASEAEDQYNKLLSSVMYPTHDSNMLAWWFVIIIVLGLRFIKTLNDFHAISAKETSENKATGIMSYGLPGCMMCKACLLRTYC